MNAARRPVAVVVGATSKWQADGRNTKLAHGRTLDDSDLPVGVRWGVGGAIAQKFSKEGFFVVVTTRQKANAVGLEKALQDRPQVVGRERVQLLDPHHRLPLRLTTPGVPLDVGPDLAAAQHQPLDPLRPRPGVVAGRTEGALG